MPAGAGGVQSIIGPTGFASSQTQQGIDNLAKSIFGGNQQVWGSAFPFPVGIPQISIPAGLGDIQILATGQSILEVVLDAIAGGGNNTTPDPVGAAVLADQTGIEWLPGGSIYEQNPQPETDWDQVYIDYQILNESPSVQTDEYEREDMAIDWGGLFNIGVDYLQGQTGGTGYSPAPNQFVQPTPGINYPVATAQPRTVTIDTVTGKVTACKRRRRRRLLTEGDFNDLMRISTLPNKETVKIALAKSIGRR